MGFLRRCYYYIPPSGRLLARRLYYLPYDIVHALFYPRQLMPPRGLIFTGGGDFLKQGEIFTSYFIQYANLQPDAKVLDVGCGIGRMAIGLTRYLSPDGSYEGFDVMPAGINWCKNHITRQFSNFRFTLVHVQNDLYKTDGTAADKFQFPYAPGIFDFVFLTSVFTHMLPEEVEHYMTEIYRVMKPGAKCLATFFLLNETSMACMAEKKEFRFPHNYGHYRLFDPKVKHANVAFDQNYVIENLVQKNGFKINHLLYGWWSGRQLGNEVDFQDMVVFEKL